mmetsp:Transcript_37577/g.58695  ORF Transcript_37577/g.58695 Transcript_37577/m.58695 type:complete len:982 (-) Transcript_37577:453-3398(-)
MVSQEPHHVPSPPNPPRGSSPHPRPSLGVHHVVVVVLLDVLQQLVHRGLGVAQQHVRVLLHKDRVVHARVPRGHGPLHHHHPLALPYLNDGHAGDGRVGVLLGRRVDGVVGADDQRDVRLVDVLVDLLHLLHDVVGHARLRQQHVQLPRHAAGDGVDAEDDLDAVVAEDLHQVGDGVLRLGHRQAVPGHDAHLLGVRQVLRHRGVVHDGGLAHHLHGRPLGRLPVAAQQHAADVAVHRVAHHVGEHGARGADERAHHREHGLVQHEALRAEGPPAVGVQHRDHHGHVRPADGGRHVRAQPAREQGGRAQARQAGLGGGLRHEAGQGGQRGGARGHVHLVAPGQRQGRALQQPLQLAEGHHGARGRDAPDPGGQVDGAQPDGVQRGGVVHVVQVVRGGGARGGQAHQRVEGGHRLRQLRGPHALGDLVARGPAGAGQQRQLPVGARVGRRHHAQCGGQPEGDAAHAQHVAHARGLLRAQAADAAHAAEAGGHRGHRVHLGAAQPLGQRVPPDERPGGGGVVVVVLWGVVRALEHVQHLLRHEKPAANVHRGHADGGGGQGLGAVAGQEAAAHGEHAAHGGHARDGVGHGHQRRVQRVRHTVHHLVADDVGQGEGAQHGAEGRGGGGRAQCQRARRARAVQLRALPVEGLVVHGNGRLLLLLELGHGHEGGLLQGGRRPHQLAPLHHQAPAHGLVVVVQLEHALLLGAEGPGGQHELGEVVGQQEGGRVGQVRGHVRVPHAGHAVGGRVHLVAARGGDVPAGLGGQVHGHGAGLHHVHHVLADQLRGLLPRDQRRADDDVHLLALLLQHPGRRVEPLLAHLLGVAASRGPVLGVLHHEELAAHGLDLLLGRRPHVEGPHDGAHVLSRLYCCQARHTTTNHQHLGGGHAAGGGHLAREEPVEARGRLDHRPVPRNVRLRAQRVVRLRARERPVQGVDAEGGGPLLLQLRDELRVHGRVQEGERGAVLQQGRLLRRRRLHFQNEI